MPRAISSSSCVGVALQPLVRLLIAAWYAAHRERGGAPDPVQEDLMEEARLEEEHGSGFMYPPGHD